MSVCVRQIEQVLAQHRSGRRMLRPLLRRAAVAMILRDEGGEAQILMIKRAARDGDPWSGHMAFPGGRMEKEDQSLRETAIRETFEEVGLISP